MWGDFVLIPLGGSKRLYPGAIQLKLKSFLQARSGKLAWGSHNPMSRSINCGFRASGSLFFNQACNPMSRAFPVWSTPYEFVCSGHLWFRAFDSLLINRVSAFGHKR